MSKEISRDDVIGRNPGFTFTETAVGDMVLVELKDAVGGVVAKSRNLNADDAYAAVRESMGLSDELPVLTTTELGAIAPEDGTLAVNGTTLSLTFYLRGAWR